MATVGTPELSVQERGILASSSSTLYADHFSRSTRELVGGFQVRSVHEQKRCYFSRGKCFLVRWEDAGQPLPEWFDSVMQGLVDLATLEPGWDSYRAPAIDPTLIQRALRFVNELLSPHTPAPWVVPLSSGGLQLEWRRNGANLEVVFDREEAPFFYYRNESTGVEEEGVLPASREVFTRILGALE